MSPTRAVGAARRRAQPAVTRSPSDTIVQAGGDNENQNTTSQEGFASGADFRDVAGERGRIRPDRRAERGPGHRSRRPSKTDRRYRYQHQGRRRRSDPASRSASASSTSRRPPRPTCPRSSTRFRRCAPTDRWPRAKTSGRSTRRRFTSSAAPRRTPRWSSSTACVRPAAARSSTRSIRTSFRLRRSQRVDVLADGASSVYGSDAVAGVVNFITRKTIRRCADQFLVRQSRQLRHLGSERPLGHRPGKRAASTPRRQYSYASQLFVRDRDWASRGDYRDVRRLQHQQLHLRPRDHSRHRREQRHGAGRQPDFPLRQTRPRRWPTTPRSTPTCNLSVYNSFIPSQYRANG